MEAIRSNEMLVLIRTARRYVPEVGKIHYCRFENFIVHTDSLYSVSHSRVAPENVGLQKEQKCNTFACHTCNKVRLYVLEIRKKEIGNEKIR
jgi:hypothetical protein